MRKLSDGELDTLRGWATQVTCSDCAKHDDIAAIAEMVTFAVAEVSDRRSVDRVLANNTTTRVRTYSGRRRK